MSEDTIANPTLWSPSEKRIKESEMYRFIKTIIFLIYLFKNLKI